MGNPKRSRAPACVCRPSRLDARQVLCQRPCEVRLVILLTRKAETGVHMEQVRISVCALDSITEVGVTNCLSAEKDLLVLAPQQCRQADVVVAVFERLSAGALQAMRTAAAETGKPMVLLVDHIDGTDLLAAVNCRVVAILPRAAAVDSRVGNAVRAAVQCGASPPANLLGRLVEHIELLHREVLEPNGLAGATLERREVEVLRMMADRLDTNEIARRMSCSERTIKKIIFDITTTLRVRNRPHAVACAMRAGVI